MHHIFSKIPTSVVEMYNITTNGDFIFIRDNNNHYGIANQDVKISENEYAIEFTANTYTITLLKKIKQSITTFLK